jgi:hypothetical protein
MVTNYTRWLESVQAKEAEDQEVYVSFSPQFERIWLESKQRLPDYVSQKPANIGLRSQYSLRLYSWANKHVTVGKKLRNKAMSLGQTGNGLPNKVHLVDAGRPSPSAGLSWNQGRQETEGGYSGTSK